MEISEPVDSDRLRREAHVWVRPVEKLLGQADSEYYLASLDAEERARQRRFVRQPDRDQFLVAHGFLREVLSRYASLKPADWQFECRAGGRPEIAGCGTRFGLRFNLSHTAGLVACLVTHEIDCGIDVERLDRQCGHMALVAQRMFADDECKVLERLDDDARRYRFMEFWTLKEAYAKACGQGLRIPTRDVVFQISAQDKVRFEFRNGLDDPAQWQFELMGCQSEYRIAVALRSGGDRGREIILFE